MSSASRPAASRSSPANLQIVPIGRVHLAGSFTAVNGSPATASHAVVSITNGSTVTNVAAFGAFVDVGAHQDGLVHVSQLANKFVKAFA